MSRPQEIADGVYRLGTEWVNWYACVGDDGLVLVDAGLRSYAEELPDLLRRLGRHPREVTAIVLTHYHPDHAGGAEPLRATTGARVLAPAADAAGLKVGRIPVPPRLVTSMWRRQMRRYGAHIVQSGGVRAVRIPDVSAYADGAVPDLPVKLRAVPTPGHTAGHCALVAEDRGVLFTGDALANVDFYTREERVHVLPFNEDDHAARASVSRLETLDAEVVAFGHGPPLNGGATDIVARARR